MNLYCFVSYKLPKDFIDKFYDNNYNIIQININNETDIYNNLNKITDNLLIEKIKHINVDNKELFIKLLVLYFNGGIIINDKIILKNYDCINNLF